MNDIFTKKKPKLEQNTREALMERQRGDCL